MAQAQDLAYLRELERIQKKVPGNLGEKRQVTKVLATTRPAKVSTPKSKDLSLKNKVIPKKKQLEITKINVQSSYKSNIKSIVAP